jgi:hypothetical protein
MMTACGSLSVLLFFHRRSWILRLYRKVVRGYRVSVWVSVSVVVVVRARVSIHVQVRVRVSVRV